MHFYIILYQKPLSCIGAAQTYTYFIIFWTLNLRRELLQQCVGIFYIANTHIKEYIMSHEMILYMYPASYRGSP